MKWQRIPYNKMSFLPEEQKQCTDLISYLMNSQSDEYFNEILITSDGYCTTVIWIRKPFNKDYEMGSFEYVDDDEEIYTEDEMNEIVDARVKYALENQEVLDKILKQ